jgi:hypothetical protein
MSEQLKVKLKQVEAELSEAREEQAVLRREADKTRAEFAKSPDADPSTPTFKRAKAASELLAESVQKVEGLQAVQIGTLKMLGKDGRVRSDRNGPTGEGFAGDGWDHAANNLSISGGQLRVDMPARDLLRSPMAAGLKVSPSEGLTAPAYEVPGLVQMGADRRGLYGVFPRQQVEQGDLALTEFQQTGSRTLTGTIERDPVAVTEKAKLELEVTLATPSLVQWAAVIEKVPSRLFDSVPALLAFLESELKYQVELGVDAHCIAQIEAAAPPTGETGTTLIEKTRNAVAAMRALGASPSILALAPEDAAALDVLKTGVEGMESYIFASRATGSASPLWGLEVVEVPNLEAPTLIDPLLAGVLYTATGTVLVDPYSAMDSNQVRVRVEIDGLLHIRDISGVYVIDKP